MTPTTNWSKTPEYRLILTKASNLDWLTRDKHAMRDLCTVAKEGSHHWVPAQDLPFNEVILFAYAADHSSRPSGLYHARSGRILQQSGPNQELAPLPGIYFFDGWRVRPCMKISTDLPRTRDPPERDTQRPAATTTTAEPPQTPDEEARDILAKAIRNQADDGPSTRRAAIRANICMPWSNNTVHSSKRYMRRGIPQIPNSATRTSHRATTAHVRAAALSVHIA